MKIDLPKETWQNVIKYIDKLDDMTFEEIMDGDKQSKIFQIQVELNDFRFDLVETLDQMNIEEDNFLMIEELTNENKSRSSN